MEEKNNIQELVQAASGDGGVVYFVGIGGIGMSAIARYFHSKGATVLGYDKTPTPLTDELEKEGMTVYFTDDISLISKQVDLVLYTPAIPKKNAVLRYYQDNGYPVFKRSDVLGAITHNLFNICIAGTHGKTTISSMLGHILRQSGFGCTAFLGGISVNYGTNFWSSENNVCVVEADEYDRSFLKLSPDIAVITAMDADHLDIYGSEKAMQDTFVEFANRVNKIGLLLHKFGLRRMQDVDDVKKLSYHVTNDAADISAANIRMQNGGYIFDVSLPNKTISGLELRIGGMHNVENSIAAIAIASYLEIEEEKIRAALLTFQGVKRRFEYILPPVAQQPGSYPQPVFIDDYAHHPEELRALLTSSRSLFSQRKITVIFQPHLYSRTRDLADEFAHSLSLADAVVLLPIYPARELPLEGVTSELIFKKLDKEEKYLVEKAALLQWMQQYRVGRNKEFGDVIITAGAGDIDALVQPLKKVIQMT